MGLPWVRLDCAFPRNPKLLAMLAEKNGHRAALAYLCSLAYSGEQGTDGFIPREALAFCHARSDDVVTLERHGFWWPQPGGWLIHDWDSYQESTAETQKRRIRAQAGAAARWNGHEPQTPAERQKRYRERQQTREGDGASDNANGS